MEPSSRNALLPDRSLSEDVGNARSRAAIIVAALAMAAVTMGVMVVLPAKLESSGGDPAQPVMAAHAIRGVELAHAHVDSSH